LLIAYFFLLSQLVSHLFALSFFFCTLRRQPRSTLFPYTTLFRSIRTHTRYDDFIMRVYNDYGLSYSKKDLYIPIYGFLASKYKQPLGRGCLLTLYLFYFLSAKTS